MATKKAGKLTKEQDGYQVIFERHYAHDVMTVWNAITNPEKLASWFMKVEMKLEVGARMIIHFGDEENTKTYGTITAAKPGKLFEYIWENEDAEDEITRWELFPEGTSACRLVLTHTRIDKTYADRVPAGWHIMLDRLEEILNGRLEPFPSSTDAPGEIEIKSLYKEFVNKTFKQL